LIQSWKSLIIILLGKHDYLILMCSLILLSIYIDHNYLLSEASLSEILLIEIELPLLELFSALIHHVLEPLYMLFTADYRVSDALVFLQR